MAANQEAGIWLEITRTHCDYAGVKFQGRDGINWDHHSKASLTVGYSQQERVALADAAVKIFQENFGFIPRSVAAWYLDAFTLEYLQKKYAVKAMANCRDQWGLARPHLPRRPGDDRPGGGLELPQALPRRRLRPQPRLNGPAETNACASARENLRRGRYRSCCSSSSANMIPWCERQAHFCRTPHKKTFRLLTKLKKEYILSDTDI